MTVEGFTNYATAGATITWAHDRVLNEHARANVLNHEDVDGTQQVREGTWTHDEAIRFALADFLKAETERLCEIATSGPRATATLLAAQMLQAGMSEVDWNEVARYFLTD